MKLISVIVEEAKPPGFAATHLVHIRPSLSYPEVKTTFFCGGAYGSRRQDHPPWVPPSLASRATCPRCIRRLVELKQELYLKVFGTDEEEREHLRKYIEAPTGVPFYAISMTRLRKELARFRSTPETL